MNIVAMYCTNDYSSLKIGENSRYEGIGVRFKFMARLRSQGIGTYVYKKSINYE